MTPVTRTLAEFAAELRYDAMPGEVGERACQLVLDQMGIVLRARHEAELARPAADALAALGLGAGDATVLGDAAGYAPPAAAFFNGSLGHSLDFDDTHAAGSIHPSAPIVPAALAAAQMAQAHGRDVVTAIVAGYEIQIRLSLALGPSDHYRRGFHPTATCGVFGAAAAAGRVLGLDADGIADALGLAGSQAAGSMQFLVNGAWNKAYHTGYAAMGGLVAASFAARGFRGSAEALEGAAGFLAAYAPDPVPEKAVSRLGEVWETLAIAVKPYPSCRYGHAAMDALIALREEHDIDFRAVEAIEIGLPRTGWNIIGTPQDEKRAPRNYVDGQFSMPFVAAVALRDGGMDWDAYARHLDDADTRALCAKVSTVVDEDVDGHFPRHMAGKATVRTDKGEWSRLVVAARGEPENFLDAQALRGKFDALASPYVDTERRDALAASVLALPDCEDVAALLRATRPRAAAQLRAAGGGD